MDEFEPQGQVRFVPVLYKSPSLDIEVSAASRTLLQSNSSSSAPSEIQHSPSTPPPKHSPSTLSSTVSSPPLSPTINSYENTSAPSESVPPLSSVTPRRSQRERNPPERYGLIGLAWELSTYQEAISCIDSDKWQTVTVTLHCDNTASINISNNPIVSSRTKHIDIHYHYIRERLINKDFHLEYISTTSNLADIFTKPLDIGKQLGILQQLGYV